MESIIKRTRTETEKLPKTDHLPDIEASMKQNGRLISFHEKWLIFEIKELRKKIDEVQKLIDKYEGRS